MIKTVVNPDFKFKAFCHSKIYNRQREKEIVLTTSKFYQKLIIVLISLSAILIFPESPKNLESICEAYNSRRICNVW